MEFPFLKAVAVFLLAVFGMVLLASSARAHSGLDGGMGVVLLLGATLLFGIWFARR